MKKTTKGILYVALYIDDNLMVWNSEPIDVAMETFYQHGVVLNVLEGLQNYLS